MLFITLSAILIYILIYLQVKRQTIIDELYDKTGSKMRLIYDAAPIGIVLVKDRIFIEENKFFCEMLGYSESELVGRTSRHLYRTQAEFERVGRIYESLLNESQGPIVIETEHLRKSGEEVKVVITLIPINPSNRPKARSVSSTM
jgi:PAS domain S-box-containing protein